MTGVTGSRYKITTSVLDLHIGVAEAVLKHFEVFPLKSSVGWGSLEQNQNIGILQFQLFK